MAEDLRFDDPEFPFGYFLVAGPGGYVRAAADQPQQPWKRCPSTHCERRGECASPGDCMVKSRPPMHYALATDYTVDDMQAKLL